MRPIPRRFRLALGCYLAAVVAPLAVLVLRPSLAPVAYLPVAAVALLSLGAGAWAAGGLTDRLRYRLWTARGVAVLLVAPAAYLGATASEMAADAPLSATGPLLAGVFCGAVTALAVAATAHHASVPTDRGRVLYAWEGRAAPRTVQEHRVVAVLVLLFGLAAGAWQFLTGDEPIVAAVLAIGPALAVAPTLLDDGVREWQVDETGVAKGSDHRPWATFRGYAVTDDVVVLQGADWHGPRRLARDDVPDEAELLATVEEFLPREDH